jgi:hypothetical protein
MPVPMEKVSDEFANLELPDHEGRVQRLGDLWRERAALLVFVRHFG